jgi:hypothetical protein
MSEEKDNALDHVLVKHIKKYIDRQEKYKEALKIVQKQKKAQEEIKEMFQQRRIQTYTLRRDGYHAVLEFKPTSYYKIDTSRLPESIKEQYKKQVVMRKEHLVVHETPNGKNPS